MGGKSSKRPALERNTTIRQSQAKRLTTIKRKCESIEKRLKKLEGEDDCDVLEKEVLTVQDLLQEISPELKEKYKKAFDEYVGRCERFLEVIKERRGEERVEDVAEIVARPVSETNASVVSVKPIRTPVCAVEEVERTTCLEEPVAESPTFSEAAKKLDLTKTAGVNEARSATPLSEKSFSFEGTTLERRKKKLKKTKGETRTRKISIEEQSFRAIDKARMEMSDLRDEVLTFKGTQDDQLYHFLKESFARYIAKLEEIDIFDNKQIKYERRLAIAFARDSITALRELAAGSDVNKVRRSLIEHDQLSKIQCVSKNDLLDHNDEVFETENDHQTTPQYNTEDKLSSSEGEVDMRDFKKSLDAKLGAMSRISRMNVVTINMIKKSKQSDALDNSVDQSEGDTSGDDIDDILHTLTVSTECISPPLKVTSI